MTDQNPDEGPNGTPDPDSPQPPPLEDGSRDIGPYRLLSVLGKGGMGIVYLAEQTEPLRRRVALKVLKAGMDTEQVLARFESERQALAVMDHPNIAKVFDSGVTSSGRPYFVMEVVPGVPITRYADTHRLTTAERLRLFVPVCGAVQHAHLKGVIHRDLKPSNVLVSTGDSGPIVKVIDFGLAKAVGVGLTEHTLVTRVGQQLGTPDYMSPEQAEMSGLDVDARTDVYSLGVMLYELLVGYRPFLLLVQPGHELSQALRDTDVPRPSNRLKSLGGSLETVVRHRRTTAQSLRSELKGDLDWIVLKAMEKDRTRRYDTPSALALDLTRHLSHEPVLARPPSARYRLRKFARRNRTGVVAASVALVAILAGAGMAAAGFVQAVAERERAERSALIAQQAADFLADLFEASDPAEAPGTTVTARDLLDRASSRIPSELADDPAVQAVLLRTIGVAYHRLGDYQEAASLLEQAVALGEAAAGPDDSELAHALQRLGMVYRVQGRADEAEATFLRAIELDRGQREPETARLLSSTTNLAGLYMSQGRYAEATPLLSGVADMQEALLGSDHPDLSATFHLWGALHLRMREAREAMPYLERALSLRERTLSPDHPLIARTLVNLGAGHLILEEYDEAEIATRRAARIIEQALGPEHLELGYAWNNLGEVHVARGDHARAEEYLLRAWRVKEAALGPDNVTMPTTYRMLGNVYRDQGRLEEAEGLYRDALRILAESVEPGDPAVRETREDLALLLRLADRHAEAAELEAQVAASDGGPGGG